MGDKKKTMGYKIVVLYLNTYMQKTHQNVIKTTKWI